MNWYTDQVAKQQASPLTRWFSMDEIEFMNMDSIQPQVCPYCGETGDELEPDAVSKCPECGRRAYSISEWVLRGLPV